jgi:hypothetical protein
VATSAVARLSHPRWAWRTVAASPARVPVRQLLRLRLLLALGGPRKHTEMSSVGQTDVAVSLKILSEFNSGELVCEKSFLTGTKGGVHRAGIVKAAKGAL